MRFPGTITVTNTRNDDFINNRVEVRALYKCGYADCESSYESIQVGPDDEIADIIDGLDKAAAMYAASHTKAHTPGRVRDHHGHDKGPYAGPWKTHAEAAAPGRPTGDLPPYQYTGGPAVGAGEPHFNYGLFQTIPGTFDNHVTPEDDALFDRGTKYGTKPVEVAFLVHPTLDGMALLPTPRRNGKRGKRGPVGPQGPQGAKGDPGLPPAPDEVYNAVARWFEEHPHRIYTNPELMGFFVTPEAQASNTDVTPESVAEAANPQVVTEDDGYTPRQSDLDRQRQLAALVEVLQSNSPTGWASHEGMVDGWLGTRTALNKTLHAMLKDGSIEADYGTEDNRYRLHVA